MSAFGERRQQDLIKLQELAARSNGRVKIVSSTGNPLARVELSLSYRTAPNDSYPRSVQTATTVVIDLPAKYPFAEPSASITTPIFHPNVYSSGRICFGVKWLPSEGLDLLVQRVIQIITFDPLVLNEASPANPTALTWYRSARAKGVQFPTDNPATAPAAEKPSMTWSNVAEPSQRTVVSCPSCSARLSLPAGKKGKVNCPKCRQMVEVNT